MPLVLHRSWLLLLLLLALTTGCAGLNRYAEGPEVTGPPEGSARVYFALPQGFPSGQAYVVENTTLLGFVQNNQYFYVDVPAGEHLFMLISEQTEGIRGNFEAGKTYHLKLYITPGFMSTRVYWTPLETTGEDAKTRVEDIEESRRVELNPDKVPKWEAKYADRNRKRVENFEAGEDDVTIIEPKHGL
ncbi:MAG: hypothetical protein KDK70_13850 [Myxococcales bacterium]|nr:hypothetical protein [Myxococcales bacterium]